MSYTRGGSDLIETLVPNIIMVNYDSHEIVTKNLLLRNSSKTIINEYRPEMDTKWLQKANNGKSRDDCNRNFAFSQLKKIVGD